MNTTGPPSSFWTTAKLDEMSNTGDPEADALVQAYLAASGVTSPALMADMVRHKALPPDEDFPAIAEYLAARPALPGWVDGDAVQRCERLFGDDGPAMGWAMFCVSFPASYASFRGARILSFTGRLSSHPKRRLMETTQLVWDSMQPGGLTVGGAGWIDARRVRLMHAVVRQIILADPSAPHPSDGKPAWQPEWGTPINQMELAAFIMPMTLTVFDCLHILGFDLTESQKEDLLHTWCVIGHVMGVADGLLPMNLESATAFWTKVQAREYRHNKDGVTLMAAHNEMLAGLAPGLLKHLPETVQRVVLGDELCDMLEIGKANWTRHLFGVARAITSRLWLAELHDKGLAKIADKMGRTAIDGFLTLERGGERPKFEIPDELATAWNIGT